MRAMWRRIPWVGAWLVGALLLAVAPVLADGRTVNPSPTAAPVARTPSEVAAHVPLIDLLALIPDTEANRTWLSYGDVNGWHEATGVPRPASLDALETFTALYRKAWLFTLTAQTVPPEALGAAYLGANEMRPVWGFDYLDTAQALEAGQQVDRLTWANLNLPPDEIAAALAASNYAATAATRRYPLQPRPRLRR